MCVVTDRKSTEKTICGKRSNGKLANNPVSRMSVHTIQDEVSDQTIVTTKLKSKEFVTFDMPTGKRDPIDLQGIRERMRSEKLKSNSYPLLSKVISRWCNKDFRNGRP